METLLGSFVSPQGVKVIQPVPGRFGFRVEERPEGHILLLRVLAVGEEGAQDVDSFSLPLFILAVEEEGSKIVPPWARVQGGAPGNPRPQKKDGQPGDEM
jgi:hypothetical protein